MEDNKDLNKANARALELFGYEVHQALTLAAARLYLSNSEPDVILLDVMLPDGDGISFCAEIRATTKAHILFLSAKNDRSDIVSGLGAGGDDYIVKPFHPEELLARVDAAMRRRKMTGIPGRIKKGALVLDTVVARAFIKNEDLLLQPREFALLLLLAQNESEIVDADALYKTAWRRPMAGDRNALQVAVSKIRAKLGGSGYTVTSVRGKGYIFEKA